MQFLINGAAIVAVIPGVLFLFLALQSSNSATERLALAFAVFVWWGMVALAWWVATSVAIKAAKGLDFATDQIERRTRSIEQQVDAEALERIASSGKTADESETARDWAQRAHAFDRLIKPKD